MRRVFSSARYFLQADAGSRRRSAFSPTGAGRSRGIGPAVSSRLRAPFDRESLFVQQRADAPDQEYLVMLVNSAGCRAA